MRLPFSPSLLSIFLSMNILNPTHLAMILLMQLLLHLMILLRCSKKTWKTNTGSTSG
jgi:hypothetical protein